MKTLSVSTVTLGSATGTLTWDNSAGPSNNDTVTIGSKTYTFKTALTPTEGEVLLNGGGDAALLNLIRAINHTGTPDTDYKCAAANTQVSAASSVTAHAFAITALSAGLAGNSIATTETSANLAWGAATLSGGETISITGTIADTTFTRPAQQVTVGEFPTGNTNWSRSWQVSSDAVFCKRFGASGVAFLLPQLAEIAVTLEPTTTWAPLFTTQPDDLTDASNTSSSFTIAVSSELTTTYQWQVSTDSGANWSNLSNAGVYSGVTTVTLSISDNTGLGGYQYRCVATNAAGSTNSDAATLTLTPAILTESGNDSAVAPAQADFSITAEGQGTLTYQWQVNDGGGYDNIANGSSYSGATTAALAINPTNVGLNGYSYRCVVTTAYGSATSGAMTLTVT